VPILGVNIGGVIVARVANDSDTNFFGERPMDTSAVDGVFEALRHLVSDVFEYRVHIVSKAGPRIATLSREWLARNGVFKDIGIPESNLWFVRKRPEKAPICAQLGITHFVDDRVDVLQHLTTVTHRFLFLDGLGPFTPPRSSPNTVPRSHTWPELVAQIKGTL